MLHSPQLLQTLSEIVIGVNGGIDGGSEELNVMIKHVG